MEANFAYWVVMKLGWRIPRVNVKINPGAGWRVVAPVLIIVLIRLIRQIGLIGDWRMWAGNLVLVAGRVIGWLLVEGDHLLYALACDPANPTCSMVKTYLQKRQWKAAWEALEKTKAERTKLPIKNMLTALVVAGVGIWVVTSSGSFLGAGVVLGLGVRLLWEMLTDEDYRKWYWVFARPFSEIEHRGLVAALIVAMAVQILTVIR